MAKRSSPIVEVIALQQALERMRLLIRTAPEAARMYEGVWRDLQDRQGQLLDGMGQDDLTQLELLAGASADSFGDL